MSSALRRATLLLAGALPFVGGGCARQRSSDPWSLYYALMSSRRIEIHVPKEERGEDGEGPLAEKARLLERAMASAWGLHGQVIADGSDGDPRLPRVVFGTGDDPRVATLARRIGVSFLEPRGFAWLGREYRSPDDALVACLEDPERPGLPVAIFLGNEKAALARIVREIPAPWEPRIATFRQGEPALAVRSSLVGIPVLETLVDHASERSRIWKGAEEWTQKGIVFHIPSGLRRERVSLYAQRCAEARGHVESWLAGADGGRRERTLEVFLYEHLEDLERCLGFAELSWANPHGTRAHVLLAEGVPDDAGAAVARATAFEIAGEPAEPWLLSGLALAAAGAYWGKPLSAWMEHLEQAFVLPSDDALRDPNLGRSWSEHVVGPAQARLFLACFEAWKSDGLAEVWRGEKRVSLGPESQASPPDKSPESDRPPRKPASFWSGVALHDLPAEGLLASSYASRAAGANLERARDLGARSFSLSVRAALEPSHPALARLDGRAVHGSASDAALFQAIAAGRAADLACMLVVDPLTVPSGTWADAGGIITAEDLALLFARLNRIGEHYGLFAELAGVDLLCFGECLRFASDSRKAGPARQDLRNEQRSKWRELFARMRALFGGALTYGAGSEHEAQNLEFWGDLDFVSVHLWPNLEELDSSSDERAIAARLRSALERVRILGAEVDRDVVLLQVGFPSRSGAWARPSAPRGEDDEQGQERFYAGLARALAGLREPPLRGFFLWNLPAGSGGAFSVLHKPAEQEVARLLRNG